MDALQRVLGSSTFWIVLPLSAVLAFWLLGAYNRLMRLRAAVVSTFPALGIQLRKRHSLIRHLAEMLIKPSPELPTTFPASVIGAAVDALKAVQTATDVVDRLPKRSASPGPMMDLQVAETALEAADDALDEALKNAALEAPLPQHVAELLDRLRRLGNPIAYSGGVYNQAAEAYNDALTLFPTTLAVRLFVFQPAVVLALRRPSARQALAVPGLLPDAPDFSTTTTADLEPL